MTSSNLSGGRLEPANGDSGRTSTIDICAGLDGLRLISQSPAGFHLLGKFDSGHEAQLARRAAEWASDRLAELLAVRLKGRG